MRADLDVLSAELHRYIEVLDICALGLNDSAHTIARMCETNPYGALLRSVPEIYRAQHDEQVRLTDSVVHNFELLATRLRTVVAAYDRGDPDAAEQAMLEGTGVPQVEERRTEVVFPGPTNTYAIDTARTIDVGESWATMLADRKWLIGNVDVIAEMVETWTDVADSVHQLTDRLEGALNSLDAWSGAAAGEHLRLIRANIEAMRGLADISQALGHAMNACVVVTSLANQWIEAVRTAYQAAWGGERRVRLEEQVRANLNFAALEIAILARLRNTMVG